MQENGKDKDGLDVIVRINLSTLTPKSSQVLDGSKSITNNMNTDDEQKNFSLNKRSSKITEYSSSNNYNTTTSSSTNSIVETMIAPKIKKVVGLRVQEVEMASDASHAAWFLQKKKRLSNKHDRYQHGNNDDRQYHALLKGEKRKRDDILLENSLKHDSACSTNSTTGTGTGTVSTYISSSRTNASCSTNPTDPTTKNENQRETLDEEDELCNIKVNHPFMNKRVRIMEGRFEGYTGKITKIEARGWWTLDNPNLNGTKIHSRLCKILDEVDTLEYASYVRGKRKRYRKNRHMPQFSSDHHYHPQNPVTTTYSQNKNTESIISPSNDSNNTPAHHMEEQTCTEQSDKGLSSLKETTTEVTRRKRPKRVAANCVSYKSNSDSFHHELYDTTWVSTHTQKQHKSNFNQASKSKAKKFKDVKKTQPQPHRNHNNHSNHPSSSPNYTSSSKYRTNQESQLCTTPTNSRLSLKTFSHTKTLAPVLLHPHNDTIIPEALRHLPLSYKVDLMNRKTGKILRGENAVSIKDLPNLLRNHAELEPLVPSLQFNHLSHTKFSDLSIPRQARSSPNTRISAQVQPQSRVRTSKGEGRLVRVKGGPYTDMIGKIEACIRGGWYLVSNLLNGDLHSLDVLIHSTKLELLEEYSNKQFE